MIMIVKEARAWSVRTYFVRTCTMCAYVLDQEDTVELIAAAAMLGVGAAQPVRVIEQDGG